MYSKDFILYFDNRGVKKDKTGRMRLHDKEYVSGADFEELDSPRVDDILNKKDRLTRPVFIAHISITAKESRLLQDRTKAAFKNYYVKFNARQTFWKYYLLGNMERGKLYVTDLNKENEFVSAGRESLPDSRTALIMRSTSPIPLREKFDCRFQLRQEGKAGEKVIIKRLPFASARQLSREIINNKDAEVSEIFINS